MISADLPRFGLQLQFDFVPLGSLVIQMGQSVTCNGTPECLSKLNPANKSSYNGQTCTVPADTLLSNPYLVLSSGRRCSNWAPCVIQMGQSVTIRKVESIYHRILPQRSKPFQNQSSLFNKYLITSKYHQLQVRNLKQISPEFSIMMNQFLKRMLLLA